MESSTTAKDLCEPLLRLVDEHDDGEKMEAQQQQSHDVTTITQQQKEEPATQQQPPRRVLMFCGWHGFVDEWHRSFAGIFMTAMLLVQYRVACVGSGNSSSAVHFDAALITQISCFGMAGWMFRLALTGDEGTFLQLWPEVTTDALLLLILLGYTRLSVWTMNILSLSMCLHASWNHWEALQKRQAEGGLSPAVGLDLTQHIRGLLPNKPPTCYSKKVDAVDEEHDTESSSDDGETNVSTSV